MSVRGGGARLRRAYMRMLLEIIMENNGISLKKLEALAGWRVGLSPRRVREYLEQLTLAGLVEERDGGFYYVRG